MWIYLAGSAIAILLLLLMFIRYRQSELDLEGVYIALVIGLFSWAGIAFLVIGTLHSIKDTVIWRRKP
jgi:ABC-type dipeptide/oligopeptide/nickel transport system permease subunit